ncbi:MAG: glycosyltransferase family 4 protein [Desulfuromonadaceae bacterium]
MKICLIAPIPPFRGGIAKYCYSLAQELEKRHDLLLLSYKRQYPEFLYGKKNQIDPNICREDIATGFKRLSYDIDSASILSWRATTDKIAAFAPDLVILPWWVAYWAPMYAYLISSLKKKGIKVVFICINVFEHEDTALKKSVAKFILSRADSIIVHSEQEQRSLLEFNPKAAVKKHLLPLFEYDIGAAFKPDTKFHLLFFGFVRPYKGLDVLLNAIGILKDYDLSLEIVGEFWNNKNEYIKRIKELGISSKVTIVDTYVPDNQMSQYFSRADLIVLPYRKTITSGVIATAYGFKKPVLATNVGGFYEVIQDGCTGKMVTPDDPQSFADGILWFLANRQIDFAENISTFTAQHMSWGSLVDTIEEFSRL